MRILSKMLVQTAVYWPLANTDSGGLVYDDYGQPQHSDPVEISCRWEERTEEFVGLDGTTIMSKAVVYVGQDLSIGGLLMLGTLSDITNETTPRENSGAWEIKGWSKIPTLKATHFLRQAYL